eukprot:c12034_g1_i1.p1 GENE.c12034_g1_i1~~c12034_g1_i1.p1  ORF type:complete len:156 (+),score=33.57 c12034_g1_i1:101-568(+)
MPKEAACENAPAQNQEPEAAILVTKELNSSAPQPDIELADIPDAAPANKESPQSPKEVDDPQNEPETVQEQKSQEENTNTAPTPGTTETTAEPEASKAETASSESEIDSKKADGAVGDQNHVESADTTPASDESSSHKRPATCDLDEHDSKKQRQ